MRMPPRPVKRTSPGSRAFLPHPAAAAAAAAAREGGGRQSGMPRAGAGGCRAAPAPGWIPARWGGRKMAAVRAELAKLGGIVCRIAEDTAEAARPCGPAGRMTPAGLRRSPAGSSGRARAAFAFGDAPLRPAGAGLLPGPASGARNQRTSAGSASRGRGAQAGAKIAMRSARRGVPPLRSPAAKALGRKRAGPCGSLGPPARPPFRRGCP